ncbi:MAG: isochorismatase family protein [Proteobacteria bacterium]|nr:isochorismatase family protein [Pseudomonadota bacterium]
MARGKDTIVDEWDTVEVPPPPELKQVQVDPKVTALLILDIQSQNCNVERRPRCVGSVPKIKKLLTEARTKGLSVVYSLPRTGSISDIIEDVFPLEGEPVVQSGPDKFFHTDLEEILMEKNVETVIVVGTAAHGAVLHTATGAALRGLRVIVPVDGMSASDLYPEQYTAWHLAHAPGSQKQTTLTRTDLIQFSDD